jgi:FKBP-type peptidyl-prolyl cis-trans isomerase FklB
VNPSPRRSHRVATALLCVGLGADAWGAAEDPAPPESPETTNYAIGYDLGRSLSGLQRQGIPVDPQAILRGALDALSNAEPQIGGESLGKALERLGAQNPGAGATPEPTATAPPPARTRGFVDDYAALNAKRPGVVTLPSGLQYEALSAGHGRTPEGGDRVRIRYEGRLATGVVFDSTSDAAEPLSLRVADIVVPGLREALLRMKEGDRWRVVVPPRLGFGAIGNNMLRKRDLIYEIELVSVEPAEQGPPPGGTEAVAPAGGASQ